MNKFIKALKAIRDAERDFEFATASDSAVTGRRAEEKVRALIPGVMIEYPGLYPAFKVREGGEWIPTLGTAYEHTLPASEVSLYRHWRALFNLLPANRNLSLVHFGNRRRVKILAAPSVIHDLTWHVAKALGLRYNEKSGTLSTTSAENIVDRLSLEIFDRTGQLTATWL